MKQPQRGGLLFYSCAPSDDILCEQFVRALRPLVREAHLSEWAAHQTPPGTDTMQARQQRWEDATLILLLLSPDYLASDTCYQEMLNALERQQRGEVRVLPILLRPCDRSAPPLATVRCLPGNGQAVTSWGNQEQAFLAIAQEIRQLIGLPRVVVSGQLPRVQDVGLDQLRVHAARAEVPYIERDQQDKLEEAVGPGQAALVVGHSMSGKTRLAAEVVKRKFPGALLVAAESGKALRELFDGGLDPEGLVVWLDDLERFFGVDGLTVGLLDRLISGRAIAIATIRTLQLETYRPSDELRPPEWEVLQRFSEISLKRRLTGPELRRIRATVDDADVLAAVDHYGLAEYLGAGPEALDKFEKGEIANPVGQALVRAAIDWRRIGLTRPVSQEVLAKALPTYLADRPSVPRTSQAIEKGLAWATAKVNETVALLGQVFTSSNGPLFEPFEYLVDHLTGPSTPVPDPIWSLALEQAKSVELFTIGLAADRANKLATAEIAWRRVIASGPAEVASLAALSLGIQLLKQRDLAGAKAAFQQVIASGHAEAAPGAALCLGAILEMQGDLAGAKAAYQQAMASRHAEVASTAASCLEDLLEKQRELEEAKAAYQQAIASGGADYTPRAAVDLGVMLKEQGDLAGAKTAFQRAIASGDADYAPRAAFCLGVVLGEQRELEEAKAAYQQAIASGHAEWAPRAAYCLGYLLQEQGELEEAKAAFQQAIKSGYAEAAPRAAVNLGAILEMQGDLTGAKESYQRAIDSGHAEWAPAAAFGLGDLLKKQGELEEAKIAYQRAIASGHAEWAPAAAFGLGDLLAEEMDLAGAKVAFQQAIASRHAEWAPKAAVGLAGLLWVQGDLAGAKVAYQQAMASGHAEVASIAALFLGDLLEE